MKRYAPLFLALALTAAAAEPPLKVSVLENTVLCVRAGHSLDNVTDSVHDANVPSHLAGAVLDLRFTSGADTNAADYFLHQKSPLVVLINSQTRGPAATLARQLRTSASAILIGSTNDAAENLSPDIVVAVSSDDEKKFQDDPYFVVSTSASGSLSKSNNLMAFVDHTSEAELVRKRIKDGDDDGDVSTPRAEPPKPVIRDPALARAVDLLKALAVLHPSRG